MQYDCPGVYVIEKSTGPRPIEAVGTAVAGFVGLAPDDKARPGEAVGIANYKAFANEYLTKGVENALSLGVRGFFGNGGGYCYVVNIGKTGTLANGLKALEAVDDVAIIAAPGMSGVTDWLALVDHCQQETLRDRVAILDPPASKDVKNLVYLTEVATLKADGSLEDAKKIGPPKSEYAAFYYPRVNITNSKGELVTVCPSGHLAGAWARTDYTRGVHKAPANIPLAGVVGLDHNLSKHEQGQLNPKGINCIRSFADRGILIWGARTRTDAASEYRYLPVRRLVNQIKESIEEGTRWVVFEPNNESLWASIRRDVGAFLRGLWRQGALQGASEEDAFFVQCDAETNTTDDINAGRVVVRIGVAPVRPAEFVIFEIGQMSATA